MMDFDSPSAQLRQEWRDERMLTAEQNARWADELPTLPYIGAWRRYLCTSESGHPTRSASTADVAPAAVAAIAALEVPALHTSGQPTPSLIAALEARIIELEKHVRTLRSEAA